MSPNVAMPTIVTDCGPAWVEHRRGVADREVTLSALPLSMTTSLSACGRTPVVEVERVEVVVGRSTLPPSDRRTHVGVADRPCRPCRRAGRRPPRCPRPRRRRRRRLIGVDEARVERGRWSPISRLSNAARRGRSASVPCVDVGEQVVEGLADGVGEHQRAGHEGDAEHHGEAGGEEPQLAGDEVLERRCLNMARHSPKLLHAVEHRVGGRVGHLVDDATVGEEHDAVGVAGGHRVVGDHHDRLAELARRRCA